LGLYQKNIYPFQIKNHESGFHIGGNNVIIDGDDLIIDDERYKGTEGFWRLLKTLIKRKLTTKLITYGGLKSAILQKNV